jgi:ubiquinone/menaquinone biosynthesis C-methylase UbiE
MSATGGPKEVVRDGYNRVSTVYRPSQSPADAFGHTVRHHREWLEPLFRRLRRGAEVLDLGCGCGVPDARLLSERFRVTGVDISDVQIQRARRLVPNARFLRADMTEVALPSAAFAGVVCLYALIHVPLEEQPALLARIARWLMPGGLFLVTTGWTAYTGTADRWLGTNVEMYWSHADAGTYERWLQDQGFTVLRRERIPEEGAEHALFLAQLGEPEGGVVPVG